MKYLVMMFVFAQVSVSATPLVTERPIFEARRIDAQGVEFLESHLGRKLEDSEREVLAAGERIRTERSQVASFFKDWSWSTPTIIFYCVGGSLAVAGHFNGRICYDPTSGKFAHTWSTTWAGAEVAVGVSILALQGPNVSDPANYRGTYVKPVGFSVALRYYGAEGILFRGKNRAVPAGQGQGSSQDAAVDERYSAIIIGYQAGVGATADLSGTLIVE